DGGSREEMSPTERLVGRGAPGRVEAGVDERRHGGPDRVAARPPRDHGGEVPAGAVTAHAEAPRIDPEARRLRGHVAERGQRIVDAGGIAMLGREAVVDGDDAQRAADREPAAETVVALEVAGDPAATVEED